MSRPELAWLGYVGAAVRTRREALGFTQRELAARIGRPGFTRTHVTRLENRSGGITLTLFAELALALCCSCQHLQAIAEKWRELDASADHGKQVQAAE